MKKISAGELQVRKLEFLELFSPDKIEGPVSKSTIRLFFYDLFNGIDVDEVFESGVLDLNKLDNKIYFYYNSIPAFGSESTAVYSSCGSGYSSLTSHLEHPRIYLTERLDISQILSYCSPDERSDFIERLSKRGELFDDSDSLVEDYVEKNIQVFKRPLVRLLREGVIKMLLEDQIYPDDIFVNRDTSRDYLETCLKSVLPKDWPVVAVANYFLTAIIGNRLGMASASAGNNYSLKRNLLYLLKLNGLNKGDFKGVLDILRGCEAEWADESPEIVEQTLIKLSNFLESLPSRREVTEEMTMDNLRELLADFY